MGKKSYKVGLISEVITSGGDAPPVLDSKLCDLFSNPLPAVTSRTDSPESLKSGVSKKGKKKKLQHQADESLGGDKSLISSSLKSKKVLGKRKFKDVETNDEEALPNQKTPKKKRKPQSERTIGGNELLTSSSVGSTKVLGKRKLKEVETNEVEKLPSQKTPKKKKRMNTRTESVNIAVDATKTEGVEAGGSEILGKKKKGKPLPVELQNANTGRNESSVLPSKKQKSKKRREMENKKQGNNVDVDNDPQQSSQSTKNKRKKNKKTKKSGALPSSNLKNKKPPTIDEDETTDEEDKEDDALVSKIPEELDAIIEKFEHEQVASDSESENSEMEGETPDKDEEKPAKGKLKNFELNAPMEKDSEKEDRTIFVGNLPTTITDKVVNRLFKSCGNIEAVRLRGAVAEKPYHLKKAALYKKKFNPDQYSMHAYVRFKTREEAVKAASEMNGQVVDKHHMVVDLANNKRHDNRKTVFVGNIPLKVQDDQLRNFFLDCGKIHSVRIIRDRNTSLSKGFGYVNFQDTAAVELALLKHNEDFEGRALRVLRHIKKEKKPKDGTMQKPNQFPSGRRNVSSRGFQGMSWQNNTVNESGNRINALRRLSDKSTLIQETSFSGDKLAEKGTLKKKMSKPNKGEYKKAKIAAQLTGVSTTQVKKQFQGRLKRN